MCCMLILYVVKIMLSIDMLMSYLCMYVYGEKTVLIV